MPRPVAWVSSLSSDGARNLAPHSFYNVCSYESPIVHFTATAVKDSLRNVEATEPMSLTSVDFPPDEDEFTWARLDAAPSTDPATP